MPVPVREQGSWNETVVDVPGERHASGYGPSVTSTVLPAPRSVTVCGVRATGLT